MTEQRTTAETRATLRARFTVPPGPWCRICGGQLVPWIDVPPTAEFRLFRCPRPACRQHPAYIDDVVRPGDPDVLAALDDADALAGALATVGRFRDSLAFYRTEAERYRAALCFYADPHLYADHFEHDPVDYERVSSVDIDGGAIARAALDPTDATSDRTPEGEPS